MKRIAIYYLMSMSCFFVMFGWDIVNFTFASSRIHDLEGQHCARNMAKIDVALKIYIRLHNQYPYDNNGHFSLIPLKENGFIGINYLVCPYTKNFGVNHYNSNDCISYETNPNSPILGDHNYAVIFDKPGNHFNAGNVLQENGHVLEYSWSAPEVSRSDYEKWCQEIKAGDPAAGKISMLAWVDKNK